MPEISEVTHQKGAEGRTAKLLEVLKEKQLNGVLLCSFENVAYFGRTYLITQILIPDRLAFLVAKDDGQSVIMVCDIEESLTRHETVIPDVRTYVEFAEEPAQALTAMLRELELESGRLGIEARRLPASVLSFLEGELPDTSFVPIDDELDRLVMTKDGGEIQSLGLAAVVTQDAIEDAIARTPAGASELSLADAIVSGMVQAGGAPVFLVLGSGERSVLSHPFPSDITMRDESIIRVDGGARFENGILSDLARTAVVGTPSSTQAELFGMVRAAQAAIIDTIEPGRPAGDLFAACKRAFARHNVEFAAPHVGHGLGIALHESPRLHPANSIPLEPGMVLNIEPVFFLEDRGEGYHVEDLVVVTESGHRILTKPQDQLLELGAGGPREKKR